MEYVLVILMNHLAKDAVPVRELATEIYWVSLQQGVDPVTVARIIVVESRGKAKAYNAQTQDYGLMQLNKRTMGLYDIPMSCAMNWKCNLKMGVRILADVKRPCRYNVGTGSLIGIRLKNCLKYEQRLSRL